jgi:hypothetical protein
MRQRQMVAICPAKRIVIQARLHQVQSMLQRAIPALQ